MAKNLKGKVHHFLLRHASASLNQTSVRQGRVAVKKMKHVNPRDQFRNLSEVHFLKRVDHPNIVRFISAYTTLDELWIVTEFMEGGTLSQVRYLPSLRHTPYSRRCSATTRERERGSN